MAHAPYPQGPDPQHPDTVGVLIVDDQPPFLVAARQLIASTPGFEFVGEATSGEGAVTLAAALRPDLVLMDVRMPGLGGLGAARCITAARSGESAEPGHADVHQDEIGVQRRGQRHRTLARRGLPHELEAGRRRDQLPGRHEERRLVVDDQHPDGVGRPRVSSVRVWLVCHGSRALVGDAARVYPLRPTCEHVEVGPPAGRPAPSSTPPAGT